MTADLYKQDPADSPDYTQGTQPCTPERLLALLRSHRKATGHRRVTVPLRRARVREVRHHSSAVLTRRGGTGRMVAGRGTQRTAAGRGGDVVDNSTRPFRRSANPGAGSP
jgi:hypothetical protein